MFALLLLTLGSFLGHSSSLTVGGDFRSAVMDNENIYVTDGRGLSVFGLSDMRRLAEYPLNGFSFDVGLWQSNLYVAGSRGLAVLKMNPRDVKNADISWLVESRVTALAVSGENLWFSDGGGMLYGQNLASGQSILNTPITLPAVPVRIVPSLNKLYIAADSSGLYVIDLVSKTPEARKLELDGNPAVFDALPVGNLLYLATGDDGLWTVEPRNNSARIVSKVGTDGQIKRLGAFGDRIAAAAGTADLSIFSIADPRKPVLTQEEAMPGLGVGLALRDSLALLLTGTGFGKVDLSVKPNALQGIFFKRAGTGYDILEKGPVAVLAIGEGGVRTVNTVDSLSYLGSYTDASEARRVYLFGTQVYVITGTNLLKVVDVKDPNRPERGTFRQFESVLHGLDAEGETILTAEDANGVGSLWRCPCGTLKDEGRLSVEGRALDIRIIPQTKLAFVSVSPAALDVISWKDSTRMETVESIPLSRDYEKLYLDGDLLFGLDYSGALGIINVARPTRPRDLSVLELEGAPTALARQGDSLFIASGDAGVHIVDISDPSAPKLVQTIDIDAARGVAVSEGRLLVLTPFAVEAYDLK